MNTRYRLFFVLVIVAGLLNNVPAVHSQINVSPKIHVPGVNVGTNIPVKIPKKSKDSAAVADLKMQIIEKDQEILYLKARIKDQPVCPVVTVSPVR